MAGKLVKCKTCGADVAKNAASCPSCGAKLKKGHPVLGVIILLIGICIIIGAINGTKGGPAAVPDKVTMEEFNQLDTGMSYDEVVGIIGFEGELGSQVDIGVGEQYKTEIYTWSNDNGSNMNATFQGGKLVTKAQAGLK